MEVFLAPTHTKIDTILEFIENWQLLWNILTYPNYAVFGHISWNQSENIFKLFFYSEWQFELIQHRTANTWQIVIPLHFNSILPIYHIEMLGKGETLNHKLVEVISNWRGLLKVPVNLKLILNLGPAKAFALYHLCFSYFCSFLYFIFT